MLRLSLPIAGKRFAPVHLIFREVPVLVAPNVACFVRQAQFLTFAAWFVWLRHIKDIPSRMLALPGYLPSARNVSRVVPYEPMLLGRARKPPTSPEWSFELKYDGWRCIAETDRDRIRLWSRNGYDITARVPEFSELHKFVAPAVIDCELVVLDHNGRPRFEWMHSKRRPHATLIAFDVLHTGRRTIVSRPLEYRRSALECLVPIDLPLLLRSKPFEDGALLLQQCEALKLEGIVAKRIGSKYRPGTRTDDWLKIRTEYGQQVVRERMRNAHA